LTRQNQWKRAAKRGGKKEKKRFPSKPRAPSPFGSGKPAPRGRKEKSERECEDKRQKGRGSPYRRQDGKTRQKGHHTQKRPASGRSGRNAFSSGKGGKAPVPGRVPWTRRQKQSRVQQGLLCDEGKSLSMYHGGQQRTRKGKRREPLPRGIKKAQKREKTRTSSCLAALEPRLGGRKDENLGS